MGAPRHHVRPLAGSMRGHADVNAGEGPDPAHQAMASRWRRAHHWVQDVQYTGRQSTGRREEGGGEGQDFPEEGEEDEEEEAVLEGAGVPRPRHRHLRRGASVQDRQRHSVAGTPKGANAASHLADGHTGSEQSDGVLRHGQLRPGRVARHEEPVQVPLRRTDQERPGSRRVRPHDSALEGAASCAVSHAAALCTQADRSGAAEVASPEVRVHPERADERSAASTVREMPPERPAQLRSLCHVSMPPADLESSEGLEHQPEAAGAPERVQQSGRVRRGQRRGDRDAR
mmetsp:Transcript_8384/g.31561  ORF Transcript_8384/g.31561 Transcript_8384/m.31561 type:complete len:287 (+) Transcript_8384:2074-2934(+)